MSEGRVVERGKEGEGIYQVLLIIKQSLDLVRSHLISKMLVYEIKDCNDACNKTSA